MNLLPGSIPGNDIPLSFFTRYGATALTSAAGPSGWNVMKVAVPAGLVNGTELYRYANVPCTPQGRTGFYARFCKTATTDAYLSVGFLIRWFNPAGEQVGLGRYVNSRPITSTTQVDLTVDLPTPDGATSYAISVEARATTTATNIFVTQTSASDVRPYSDYSAFGVTTIYPNRRVRLSSVMGANLFPRWASSPQEAFEGAYNGNGVAGTDSRIPVSDRWQSTFYRGEMGELARWWGMKMVTNSAPPSSPNADLGTVALQFPFTKADAAGSPAGQKVGTTGIRLAAGVYDAGTYSFACWVRWNPAAGTPPTQQLGVQATAYDNTSAVTWSWSTQAYTLPANGSWVRVAYNGAAFPGGMVSPEMQINFGLVGDPLVSAMGATFALEVMGLQGCRTDGGRTIPAYRYGDGTEPVFTGYIDRWESTNTSGFGTATVEVSASDDLRIFSDTTLATPYQGAASSMGDVVAYFPLNDPAGSNPISEVAGYVASPGKLLNSTAGSRTIAFGTTNFMGGSDEGTCAEFKAPATTTSGTVIDISDPRLSNLTIGNAGYYPDKGFGLDLWFKSPIANLTRPTSGTTHYTMVVQQDSANAWGQGGMEINLALQANADLLLTSIGNSGNYWVLPKGALTDGKAHYLSISVSASPSGNSSAGRTVICKLDGGGDDPEDSSLTNIYTTPNYYWSPGDKTFIGGRMNTDGKTMTKQFVGFLSNVTFFGSSASDANNRWWWGTKNPTTTQGGSTRIAAVAPWVHQRYALNYWMWGGGTSPSSFPPLTFQNASSLSLIQDMVKSLEGAFFAARDGRIAYTVKATMDGVNLWTTAIPGNETWMSYDWNEGPEPGYAFEMDMGKVYNVVSVTRNNGGKPYTVVSEESITKYGRKTYAEEIYSAGDTWVRGHAQNLITQYAEAEARIGDLTWNLQVADAAARKILSLDLLGLLWLGGFPADAPYKEAYLRVDRITHEVTVDGPQCEWKATLSVVKVGV
ncbi:hypothetical protein [Streptomyces sp. NPDC050507]|uniref:hypothetical protein n=1 Tax=Streptomyces sp. NPDC050507 TaxID=3365619 RepID=UPI0037933BB3